MTEALETLLVLGVVCAVAVVTLTAVRTVQGYRRIRRRLAGLGRSRPQTVLLEVSRPDWWWLQRNRLQLRRAVGRAESGVRAAHAAGLPLGDLPALTRQLHAGAQAVDAALAAGPVGRGGDDLRRQARELTALADELAAAVSVAAAGDTRPATDRLVTQLRDELTAVRHGWRAGSSA